MNITKTIGVVVAFFTVCFVYYYWVIDNEAILNYGPLLMKADKDYIYYLFSADSVPQGLNSYVAVTAVGIIFRLVQYICAILLGIIALRFLPKKKTPFLTQLGNASLTVYCLHAFIAIPLGRILPMNNVWIYITLVAVCTFAISWLLSLNAINKRYTKFFLFIGEKIMKKPEK